MSHNVENMPDLIMGQPTRPFDGDVDPLARRIRELITNYAFTHKMSLHEATVRTANSVGAL